MQVIERDEALSSFEAFQAEVTALAERRDAVILAHNYEVPWIQDVADHVGDSLELSRLAAETGASTIVFCGVHFMAETAKILSPEKTVLIPDRNAGCSLAASIDGAQLRAWKAEHPGAVVVSYVNTSAEVKAESDITCTSSNAVKIVESLGVDRVLFIPDQYLGKWVATQTNVEVILWEGSCIVHERFTGEEIRQHRSGIPGIKVLAHPECPPDVLAEADFVGSTSGMTKWVQREQPKKVMMITECSMAFNVAVENPAVEFVQPCNLCPYMKMITLDKIRQSLELMQFRVEVPPAIAGRARAAVERMLAVGRP